MRTIRTILMSMVIMATLVSGCKKDSAPQEDVSWAYGKWNVTYVRTSENGGYSNWLSKEWYAKFNANGSYSSKSFDYYSGTFTVKGNDITCKVGSETVIYNILSRSGNNAEAKMYYLSDPSDALWFKLVKE